MTDLTESEFADEAPASPLDTRVALLKRSRRPFVTIRHSFVQRPHDPKKPRAARGATLADLVSDHQARALDAYLMLLALEPILHPEEPMAAAIWARALSDKTLAPAAVSRTWLQLERRGLVTRKRKGALVVVRPRREDGAAAYARPGKSGSRSDSSGWPRRDWYFVMPHAYWSDGLDQQLSLAGKAALLIALQATSQNPTFYLPIEEAPQWYGISSDTAMRGLLELRKRGLLKEHFQKIAAPLSPTGHTKRTHYRPVDPFSTEARHKLQAATVRAVRRNQPTTKAKRSGR